jgi:hypothetical protein
VRNSVINLSIIFYFALINCSKYLLYKRFGLGYPSSIFCWMKVPPSERTIKGSLGHQKRKKIYDGEGLRARKSPERVPS